MRIQTQYYKFGTLNQINKMKKTIYVTIIIGIITCACSKNVIQKELLSFIGKEIYFPKSMLLYNKGNGDIAPYSECEKSLKNTIVVFFDMGDCMSCKVNNMHEWGDIVEYCQNICNIKFIFSPKEKDIQKLKAILNDSYLDTDVWIDESREFAINNECIPSNNNLHVFLLDANNKVVLAGDPLYNSKMWELYKNTLDTMIALEESEPI